MPAPYARAVTWLDVTVMSWVVAHRFPLGDRAARAVMLTGTHRVVVAAAVVIAAGWALGSAVGVGAGRLTSATRSSRRWTGGTVRRHGA
ncbi:hypothetical protein BH11ACT1_BH11ACT1_00990 [soil metagenome]